MIREPHLMIREVLSTIVKQTMPGPARLGSSGFCKLGNAQYGQTNISGRRILQHCLAILIIGLLQDMDLY